MEEQSNKPIADNVHGCSLGMDKQGRFVVARFDFGHIQKAFWLPSSVVTFLLRESPVLERANADYTFPPIEPKDWDGAQTPTVTHLKVVEASDGMALFPILDRGVSDGLLFQLDAWSIFIKNLWQYQTYLLPNSQS